MSTTTQRHRQPETPRSIALSRHRTPFRWVTDALRRSGIDARWHWLLVGAATLTALLFL